MNDSIDLKNELQKRSLKLRELNRIFLDLSKSSSIDSGDLKEALNEIVRAATQALDCERSSVWTYNPEKTAIVCNSLFIRAEDKFYDGFELKAADFPGYFRYLAEARSLAAHDAHTDPNTCEFSTVYLAPLGINSMLDAPVRIKGETAGVICSEHVGPARQWTEEEESLAGNLADLVSRAFATYEKRKAQEEVIRLNQNLERLVEEKTRNIKGMFKLINQGILTLTKGGLVEPDYSRHLETIFGHGQLGNRKFVELIFNGVENSAEKVSAVEDALESGIGAPSFRWDTNSHLLPTELVRKTPLKLQHLEIDWLPMVSEATDECEKVMVVLKDVTLLRELEATARERAKELQTLGRILLKGQISTSALLASAQKDLDFVRKSANNFQSKEELKSMFRSLHTVKGNARTFGFSSVSSAAHRAEQYLSELRNTQEGTLQKEVFNPLLAELEQELSSVETTCAKLAEFSRPTQTRESAHFPLSGLLDEILEGLSTCVKESGVSFPRCNLNAGDCLVGAKFSEEVRTVFLHLVTNSISHGLETPSERLAAGKLEKGNINVEIEKNSDSWTVRFSDDGRGFNLSKLKEKAAGYLNAKVPTKIEDCLDLAFLSGVSTLPKVSQFAGRGVGLDAARDAVRKIGGNIKLMPVSGGSADGFCKAVYEVTFPTESFVELNIAKVA